MNISILGCGWLGLPLAARLREDGHTIKGSTTRQEKIQELTSAGITPYQIQLFEEGVQGDLSSFLADSEVLIIDIPPGLRSNPEADFIGKMGRLMNYIKKSSVKDVLFVSATSVYEDKEDFPVYTEKDKANGTAINSVQLIAAENLFLNSDSFNTTVVRLGGLFGPNRHPVQYLAGRKNLANPNAPVNLIHLQDCIKILSKIISEGIWGETLNAVFPEHPTKEEYYKKTARSKNFDLPDFDHSQPSKGKIVDSLQIRSILDYEFTHSIWE